MDHLEKYNGTSLNDELEVLFSETVLPKLLGAYFENIEATEIQQKAFEILKEPSNIKSTTSFFAMLADELEYKTEKSLILVRILSATLHSSVALWKKLFKIIESNKENQQCFVSVLKTRAIYKTVADIVTQYFKSLDYDGEAYYFNKDLVQDDSKVSLYQQIHPSEMINFLWFILNQNYINSLDLQPYLDLLNEYKHLNKSFKILSM